MTIQPQCERCKRFLAPRFNGDFHCEAFSDEIPEEIQWNEHDHRKPFKGDNGLMFVESEQSKENAGA